MIDNRQIFGNHWAYKEDPFGYMPSKHFVEGFKISPSTPLYVFFILAVVHKLIRSCIPGDLRSKYGFSRKNDMIAVDEDLPNFFEAVKLGQADEIIEEYYNMKNKYGFEVYDRNVIQKLESIGTPTKWAMQGTPWYSMLSNPDYADDFNYINCKVKDRVKFIKDIHEDYNV